MDTVIVKIMDEDPKIIKKDTKLIDLSKQYQSKFKYPILLAKVNNTLSELNNPILDDSQIEFLDITDPNGFKTYQRSLVFLLFCAFKKVLGKKTRIIIQNSINKNYYCQLIDSNVELTNSILDNIKTCMHNFVEKNYIIEKVSLTIEKCFEISEEFGLYDKIEFLKFRRTANANFYKLLDFYNYFYGQLVFNTSVLGVFDLILQKDNKFILQFPNRHNNYNISKIVYYDKISTIFSESFRWSQILKINTVSSLNASICNNTIKDIIQLNEALHEKKIALISDMICNSNKKIVLVAGPSSSGKTTFSHRLSIQLRVNGFKSHIISIDDYYKNQIIKPSDVDCDFDFENLEAIDFDHLENDLFDLINNKSIKLKKFDFATGKQKISDESINLLESEIVIVEGIHALNEKISARIPKNLKFKVFISAITQLNLDDHNTIPTTDIRIIRRIVRDHHFRKLDVLSTIKIWPSVVKGEATNIFPFQEEADIIFNSALVYELSILKQYADPILFTIEKNQPQYIEATRLIKFLDSFLSVSSNEIPKNSILREFIGGSCFY